MRIGIDLDNTIIFYDHAFVRAALQQGLVPANFSGTKQQVRDIVRTLEDGERKWQALQGYVYGKGIGEASLFPGVAEFLEACRKKGKHEVFIVSHKTEYGHYDPDRVPLREAARAWLEARGIFSEILESNLHFAFTRGQKVDVIAALKLDWFIDDLVEVYEEKHFPALTKKILLHTASEPAPDGDFIVCADWQSIHDQVFGKEQFTLDDVRIIAEKLVKKPVGHIENAAGGGNSRIYKIESAGKHFALKRYPSIHTDPRDRLGTERAALQFFAQHYISCTPRWINGEAPFALMEWIEGSVVSAPTLHDIDEATAFLSQLFLLSANVSESAMPLASEACLSGHMMVDQIIQRLEKLRAVSPSQPDLHHFLENSIAPALQERSAAAQAAYRAHSWRFDAPLPFYERRLIAADFGFHNAIRLSNGHLTFIDFEYFGWDDPVKLLADFLLHPAMQLGEAMKQRFLDALFPVLDAAAKHRFLALYPLFGLRWALILLNEFLPDRWQARAAARLRDDWETVKKEQLEKAQAMLSASKTV